MLKQRVITALILLAILLPALFFSNTLPFNLIVLAMLTAGAWEWARLNHLSQRAAMATALVMLCLGIFTWFSRWTVQSHSLLWLIAGSAWILGSVALIKVGVPGWSKIPVAIRLLGGILALWVAGLAMVQAREVGINYLLSILLLVWVADIFAYFFGRTFGLKWTRVKLAPSISPGKSWEGAWGGVFGVFVLACMWVWGDAASQSQVLSIYSRLIQPGWWMLLVAVFLMAAMSVVGDLVESLIKRSAGVKDSSQLLPGHGGILDRIDALLPTLPLAMMLTTLVQ